MLEVKRVSRWEWDGVDLLLVLDYFPGNASLHERNRLTLTLTSNFTCSQKKANTNPT